jgi:cytochrome c oxidase subunit III
MTEDPPDDHASPHPHDDNAPIHIPGAGTIGMVLLIASLSMLFVASMVAYILIRSKTVAAQTTPTWPPPGLPHAPNSLWLSTIVILITSVTIQFAFNAIRRDDEKKLLKWLWTTFALGCLFLALQTFNWFEFYRAIPPGTQLQGAYLGMFYTLTGLHAAHVIGGLIPLAIVIHFARKGRYSRNFHPGVRYSTIYWHFLDAVWIILFTLLYF